MILPNMSYVEAALAVEREVGTCVPKILASTDKFGASVKKMGPSVRFPVTRESVITTRDRTDIHIILTARRRSDWDAPMFTLYIPFHLRSGLNAVLIPPVTGQLSVFTDHFFRRYRERILRDETPSLPETIRIFFNANHEVTLLRNSDANARRYLNNLSEGVEAFAARVAQGNCFGEIVQRDGNKMFLFRTIVSDDMLFENQNEAFKDIEDRRKFYEIIKKSR